MKPEKGFGTLPPKCSEWQIGKTASSIKFVKDAEFAIKYLQELVEKIKSGEMHLEEFVKISVPQEFKFKYVVEQDCYLLEPVFKKRPKKKVTLRPVELDVAGEGMAPIWSTVRDFETKELLGYLPIDSDGPVIIGPDRNYCQEFDIEIVEIGD